MNYFQANNSIVTHYKIVPAATVDFLYLLLFRQQIQILTLPDNSAIVHFFVQPHPHLHSPTVFIAPQS